MVTVLINAYWPTRFKNIPLIIDQLYSGSVKPRSVIVFNNSGQRFETVPHVTQVVSDTNFGYRAAYTAALLTNNNYYLMVDDDFTPQKHAIKNLLTHAWPKETSPGVTIGLWGKNVKEMYLQGTNVFCGEVTKPTKTDLLVGRGMVLFSRQALLNMLQLEQKILMLPEADGWDYSREQDILMTMANEAYVVPAGENQATINLGEQGVGYNRESGHYEKRNKLVKIIRKIK
jgi:hypothetical protein